MNTLMHLWHTQRLALSAFLLAVVFLGYFAVNTIMSMVYWMDPAHRDQPLAGWMTPRYVSQSYKLPPEVVASALLMVKQDMQKRQSLDAIADQNGITIEQLQAQLDSAALAFRASKAQKAGDGQ